MKRISLFEGICVAIMLSFFALMTTILCGGFLSIYLIVRIVAAVVSLSYVFYLLSRSVANIGKITLGCLAMMLIGVEVLSPLSNFEITLSGLGLAWLVRSLLIHRRPIAALMDGVLTLTALEVGVCVMSIGGGFIPAIWSLLFIQALFVFIPFSQEGQNTTTQKARASDDVFTSAFRAADSALESMVTRG